jgi:cation:H+ antiporter
MILYIALFIASCFILSWLSSRLVKTLIDIAKYLGWREFIIAFFVMSFATSLPNLFVDLNAALHGMPQLAFGDVVGGNLADLTLVMAIAVLFGKSSSMRANSRMVQTSAIFTVVIALLPLLLVFDGSLGRTDGVILLLTFLLYSFWLFSKEDRFKKTYSNKIKNPIKGFTGFLKNLGQIIFLLLLLLAASQAVVSSAQYFSTKLGISLSLVGILIVGLGNCFPEMYFSIVSARKGQNWMVLGDLMGSVIICATLVLGIIAIVAPFQIPDFSPFFIARTFLAIASIIYFVFVSTDRKITRKEGLLMLGVYVIFLLTEIFL